MAYPDKPHEGENRAHDPRLLTREAEEPAAMATPSQPQYSANRHRANGLANHDLEVTISAWWRAWAAVKPWISGLAVLAGVALWHFLNSQWFNAPVPVSQLTAVTSEQRVTNTELKADIAALTRTTQSQDRALEKLATVIGEMRADVSFMKGVFSSPHLQAYSPPTAPTPPFTRLPIQQPQHAGWSASQQ
jgi:hypothetical protein